MTQFEESEKELLHATKRLEMLAKEVGRCVAQVSAETLHCVVVNVGLGRRYLKEVQNLEVDVLKEVLPAMMPLLGGYSGDHSGTRME